MTLAPTESENPLTAAMESMLLSPIATVTCTCTPEKSAGSTHCRQHCADTALSLASFLYTQTRALHGQRMGVPSPHTVH